MISTTSSFDSALIISGLQQVCSKVSCRNFICSRARAALLLFSGVT